MAIINEFPSGGGSKMPNIYPVYTISSGKIMVWADSPDRRFYPASSSTTSYQPTAVSRVGNTSPSMVGTYYVKVIEDISGTLRLGYRKTDTSNPAYSVTNPTAGSMYIVEVVADGKSGSTYYYNYNVYDSNDSLLGTKRFGYSSGSSADFTTYIAGT